MVYSDEFDALLDAVPDEQNAALPYERAIANIVRKTASGIRFDNYYGDGRIFTKQHMADAEELIKLSQQVTAIALVTRIGLCGDATRRKKLLVVAAAVMYCVMVAASYWHLITWDGGPTNRVWGQIVFQEGNVCLVTVLASGDGDDPYPGMLDDYALFWRWQIATSNYPYWHFEKTHEITGASWRETDNLDPAALNLPLDTVPASDQGTPDPG